jgi:D-glycero-D-manno-heptose 1,7-bisphosphate phosphatase
VTKTFIETGYLEKGGGSMQKPTLEFPSGDNAIIYRGLKPDSKCAVFLDRDGTIIEDRDYLSRPEEVVIFSGVAAALKQLQDAGFLLFIVSNQSGVGRGYFTLAEVEKVNRHLAAELGRAGVRFEKIYIAPEAPDQPSRGRKPSPQFLLDARDEFGVELTRSYMVGDKLIDLECGWNAGVKKSLLVRTGYGAKLEKVSPDKLNRAMVVDDLAAAAGWILAENQPAGKS